VRFPNGLAVLPLLWPISQSLLPARVREGRGTAPLRAGAFVALLVTLAFLTLAVSLVGVRRVAYFTCVPLWDLAQISLRTNELLVPKAAITLPQLDLARLEWISRENRCDYRRVLWEGRKTQAIGWTHLTAAEAREVVARWLEAIAAHPRAYLDHRLRVTARMLFLTDLGTHGRLASKVVFGGHQLAATEAFEHAIVFSERPGYPLVERLFQRCAESLLCRPWPYLLVAIAVFASGLRRPGAHARFARTLAASGLLSVAPLPVIAPSTDFRYAVWLVAAALIGAVFALRPSGDQAR
jgi:hypothetical protein